MTFEEYKTEYGNRNHILIRMTDTFPYFKEKYYYENGNERTETNYHIANGNYCCYINYELSDGRQLSAEVSGYPKFEIYDNYGCCIFVQNTGKTSFDIRLDMITKLNNFPGPITPGEVLAIYPEELADATNKILNERTRRKYLEEEFSLTQDEINKLLNGEVP